MSNFKIDITPSVTTYELYTIATYTHWFAIGEFIDNSLTSAYNNWEELNKLYNGKYELIIEIVFDYDKKTLKISDNAAGIPDTDIQRALRAGEPPEDTSLLSVHGVGMKMSSFWFGRSLNIKTTPISLKHGYEVTVDLDEIKRTRSAEANVEEVAAKTLPGTDIYIEKIKSERILHTTGVTKLKLLLSSMYRIYLSNANRKVTIKFNGTALVYKEPNILNEPYWSDREGPDKDKPIIRWERDFSHTTKTGKVITGKVGLLENMSRFLSGFLLHYKGKGMGGIGSVDSGDEISQQDVRDTREYYRPPKIFGQEGGNRYQRFVGSFDISALGKTSSTDKPNWAGDEEYEFAEALAEFLKDPNFNMWAMAEHYAPKRLIKKQKEHAANTSEFSVEEVTALSTFFNANIRGEAIKHTENELDSSYKQQVEDIRSLNKAPVSEFVPSEKPLEIQDSSKHVHKFVTTFIENPEYILFELESKAEFAHEIRINVGHPFIRKLHWGNPAVREAVVQLIYLMAIPEVFLSLRNDRSAFRHKINEIADSTLSRLVQRTEAKNDN
jgi:hypothetical protein